MTAKPKLVLLVIRVGLIRVLVLTLIQCCKEGKNAVRLRSTMLALLVSQMCLLGCVDEGDATQPKGQTVMDIAVGMKLEVVESILGKPIREIGSGIDIYVFQGRDANTLYMAGFTGRRLIYLKETDKSLKVLATVVDAGSSEKGKGTPPSSEAPAPKP
jgi:uncharacterized protein YebE (UPF0316 family)